MIAITQFVAKVVGERGNIWHEMSQDKSGEPILKSLECHVRGAWVLFCRKQGNKVIVTGRLSQATIQRNNSGRKRQWPGCYNGLSKN